jgi:hypothetical protein
VPRAIIQRKARSLFGIVLPTGSYPVHKGHAVHKCTKRNLAVRLPSNIRCKYADEPSRSLRSLPSLFFEKPPRHLHICDGRWMENGRPDFVLCICARRGPCALDTIPLPTATLTLINCFFLPNTFFTNSFIMGEVKDVFGWGGKWNRVTFFPFIYFILYLASRTELLHFLFG